MQSPSPATYSATEVLCVANPAAGDVNLITGRLGYAVDARRQMPRAFIANVAGNLSIRDSLGNTVTFPAVAGVLYPLGNAVTMLAATTVATQVLVMW